MKVINTFEGTFVIIRLQRPESGCVVCIWCWRAAGFCVVRPFPGGRHGHAARRAGRDRGAHASGARVRRARNVCTGQVLENAETSTPSTEKQQM